ncbi:putative signal transducing protein [Halomonas sp. WWR20]
MTDRVRVFRHSNALLVSHVRNVLVSAGVPCELRNMLLGGGAGELPLGECEPEVWVALPRVSRAKALIHEALQGPDITPPGWTCRTCGESLEGVFEACWRCETPRD